MTVSDVISLALGHIQHQCLQFNPDFPGQPNLSSLHQHPPWHQASCFFQGCLKSFRHDWWSTGYFWPRRISLPVTLLRLILHQENHTPSDLNNLVIITVAGLESKRSRRDSSEHQHVSNTAENWSLSLRIRCMYLQAQLSRPTWRFIHHKVILSVTAPRIEPI